MTNKRLIAIKNFLTILFFFINKGFKRFFSARYYQKSKQKIKKESHEKCQNLSEEEKQKRWQYGRERYKNLSENEKEKLLHYRRRSYKKLENKKLIFFVLSKKQKSKKKLFLFKNLFSGKRDKFFHLLGK